MDRLEDQIEFERRYATLTHARKRPSVGSCRRQCVYNVSIQATIKFMAAHTYLAIFQSVTGNARSIPTFELRELVSSALFAVFGGFWMERGTPEGSPSTAISIIRRTFNWKVM